MEDGFSDKRERMVKHLVEDRHLRTPGIIKAFRKVPRHFFVPDSQLKAAYIDEPLPIGFGQTISAPSMVAVMLELLDIRPGDRVFEVGAGSGWNCSLAAHIAGKNGSVWTVELDENLAEFARKNSERAGTRNLRIMHGDGSRGYPEESPYDKVIITCAAPLIPAPLIEQLKEGGVIAAPVGAGLVQELIIGVKKNKKLKTKRHGGCVFVPLRH